MNRRAEEILKRLKKGAGRSHRGAASLDEEKPDSDLDVLVAVKERDPEVERSIRDAAYKVMWDYNFHPLISLKILSQEEIEERRRLNSSFLEIIEREGVNPVQGSSGP